MLENEVLLEDAFYRNWWRYTYTKLHVRKSLFRQGRLREEVEATFQWLEVIADKYNFVSRFLKSDQNGYRGHLINLSNCLVYSFHKRTQTDEFFNKDFELLLETYDHPFEKLDSQEVDLVKVLYESTRKLGYLVVSLYSEQRLDIAWEAFVKKMIVAHNDILKTKIYSYPRYHRPSKAVQVSIASKETKIADNWDLVIFYNEGDKEFHIKEQMKRLWDDRSERKSIGDSQGYDFALYIDRNRCKRRHVLEILRLQSIQLRGYSLVPLDTAELAKTIRWLERTKRRANLKEKYGVADSNDETERFYSKVKRLDKLVSRLAVMINEYYATLNEITKVNEELPKSKQGLKQDNVRRAVGLFLWVKVNISKNVPRSVNSIADEIIDLLEKEYEESVRRNRLFGGEFPSVLEYYNSQYAHFVLKEGNGFSEGDESIDSKEGIPPEAFKDDRTWDDPKTRPNIRRMIIEDYYLAELCINQADYRSPYEVRSTKKDELKRFASVDKHL